MIHGLRALRVLALLVLSATTLSAADTGSLLPSDDKLTPPQLTLLKSVPLTLIDTDAGLEQLTSFPEKAGNAADNYARLEMLFNEDRETPESFKVKKRSKGLNEILRAVSIKDCRLTPDYYPPMTDASVRQPDIIVFIAYAQAIFELAKELEEKGDFKGAGAVYRSALIFGWHLTKNAPSMLVQMLGIRIKFAAAKEYSQFLQRNLDMKRHELAEQYIDKLEKAQELYSRKLNIFLGTMYGFNSLFCCIRVATEDADPVWRQEAVLRLAVFRHGVPGSEGQILVTNDEAQGYADRALIYVTENGQPESIRKLAAWSIKQLTPESFIKLRENISKVAAENEKKK